MLKQRQPNLLLKRRLFFQDATVGELLDSKGRQLCLTMEPAIVHPRNSVFCHRKDVAIPEGNYTLEYFFDNSFFVFFFKINRIKGIGTIKLRTIPGQDVFPSQTHGDILIGMHFDAERGCLNGSDTAMYLLQRYHNHLRSLNQKPILQVCNEVPPKALLPAIGKASSSQPVSHETYDWKDLLPE